MKTTIKILEGILLVITICICVKTQFVQAAGNEIMVISEKNEKGENRKLIYLPMEVHDNTNITVLKIPKYLQNIYYDDFYETDEDMVTDYKSLTPGCTNLESVEVDKDNAYFTAVDGILYNNNMTELYFCPPAKSGRVIIPEGVERIRKCAFSDCTRITEVVLPASLNYIDEGAFGGNSSLKKIRVKKGNSSFMTKKYVLFTKNERELICYPSAKGGNEYSIPESVLIISSAAFRGNKNLVTVTFKKTLSYIGNEAFRDCDALMNINFSHGLFIIAGGAFYGCSKLEKLELPVGLQTVYNGAFNECNRLKEISLPYSLRVISGDILKGKGRIVRLYSPYLEISASDNLSGVTLYTYENSKMAQLCKTTKRYKKLTVHYIEGGYREETELNKAPESAIKGTGKIDTAWYDKKAFQYSISTPDELAGFGSLVNSGINFSKKTVTLTADLDLSCYPEWTPIGNKKVFAGSFMGDGHSIYNLRINQTVKSDGGLFGRIRNGSVQELNIFDAVVNGYNNIGILVGNADECTVKACYVSGNATGFEYVGGIAGSINGENNIIEECTSAAILDGILCTGGIAGGCNAVITNCTFTGKIISSESIGGIIGNAADARISNCTNKGTINGDVGTSGICGLSGSDTMISDCTNFGNVSGCVMTGGICGEYRYGGEVKDCINKGRITGHFATGGLVGFLPHGTLSSSINAGEITGYIATGGIVGRKAYSYPYEESIFDCESTGKVGKKTSKNNGFDTSYYVGEGDFSPSTAIVYPAIEELYTYYINDKGQAVITDCIPSDRVTNELLSLTIPNKLGGHTVAGIEGKAFAEKEIYAFKTLKSNKYFKAVDGVLYTKDMKTVVAYPYRTELSSLKIFEGVKYIGDYACYGITYDEITIPEGVISIGEAAFKGAREKRLMIPGSVKKIGKAAFSDNVELKAVYFAGDTLDY